MSSTVGVGLIGPQFISTIHARSLQQCPWTSMLAVRLPTPGNAERFAGEFGIPRRFTDHRRMLEMDEAGMVVIGAPKSAHCKLVCDAAASGKHVVLEQPMCLNLAEAGRMIDACRLAKVKPMYAEELWFAHKYVRLKQLLDSGALGEPTPPNRSVCGNEDEATVTAHPSRLHQEIQQ